MKKITITFSGSPGSDIIIRDLMEGGIDAKFPQLFYHYNNQKYALGAFITSYKIEDENPGY